MSHDHQESIAIIGMSGRFPGAKNLIEFWYNLREGIESIASLSEEELCHAGVDSSDFKNPDYVKVAGYLTDPEYFDAHFFHYSPAEAEIIDPQQRLCLECAWEALEQAGYIAANPMPTVGVYASTTLSSYLLNNLIPNQAVLTRMGLYQLILGNDKDYLSTRISYKLNLKGPSLTVQTACSSSLVAVHLACQSILHGECDMALAGGVSICFPQKKGYLYQKEMIFSPDGRCYAFDARAQGTVGGAGVGMVVLKRYKEAIKDGDTVHAIIKSSAINNDGSLKVGYTAPGLEGQASVICEALEMADIDSETVSYIETHGTGTPLGDSIEIAALTKAFTETTSQKGFCSIGSLKTNIGHLDAAAGIAGLIKTVLILKNKEIPPSLHFVSPNPKIDFAKTPFYVNTALRPWKRENWPRRAGVSSFGMGGTNAHVILEEAPLQETGESHAKEHLFILSSQTASALKSMKENLVAYLLDHPNSSLADISYTLLVGRKEFAYRYATVSQDLNGLIAALQIDTPLPASTNSSPSLIWMFPGQGSQYINMGRNLYHTEETYRKEIDACLSLIKPWIDLRPVLFSDSTECDQVSAILTQTIMTQPALFIIEYALAKLLLSWGIQPHAMVGHSLGEYVAACLADVFSLEEALGLVMTRARLMQNLPSGGMLSIPLSAEEVKTILPPALSLAAINTPNLCVVSGSYEAINTFEHFLNLRGIAPHRLKTSHAFHSSMMDPILQPFMEYVSRIRFQPPSIPIFSNVTGKLLQIEEAQDPKYWVQHLRGTVNFSSAIQEIAFQNNPLFLEIGPGKVLGSLVKRAVSTQVSVLSTLCADGGSKMDRSYLLSTLGRLWECGQSIDWQALRGGEPRHRLPLPTYPFERQRYWIEPPLNQKVDQLQVKIEKKKEALHIHKTYHPRPFLQNPYKPPENEFEVKFTKIWQDLLNVEPVGREDNFFDLGGHSLLATQLISAIEADLNITLSLQELFECPTIAQLCAKRLPAKPPDSLPVLCPAVSEHRHALFPLSFIQESLWFLNQLDPDGASYNLPVGVRIRGLLNKKALKDAFYEIVKRHEILRTRFTSIEGELFQEVKKEPIFDFQVRDMHGFSAEEIQTEIEKETQIPFDLAHGPLLRISLFSFETHNHICLITLHHIVSDGWSMKIILREFEYFYRTFTDNKRISLSEPKIQYADFASWQRSYLQGAVLDHLLSYWRKQLNGNLPLLQLPTDRLRSSDYSFKGETLIALLSSDLTHKLRLLSRGEGVTLFTTLLAVFNVLLHQYSGLQDIVIGSNVANRHRKETEEVLGCFVNTIVLRTQLIGCSTFQDLLKNVQKTALEAFSHQEIPFEKVVKELCPERREYSNPIFTVMFLLQNFAGESEKLHRPMNIGELEISLIDIPNKSSKVELTVYASEVEDEIKLFFEYSTDLYNPSTIQQMMNHYENLLAYFANHPDASMEQWPNMYPNQKDTLLKTFNETLI